MFNRDTLVTLIAGAIFISISIIIYLVANYFEKKSLVNKRISRQDVSDADNASNSPDKLIDISSRVLKTAESSFLSKLASEETRTKLRLDLIKAGYFDPSAPIMYIGWTVLFVLLFALIGLFFDLNYLNHLSALLQVLILVTFSYAGYFVTDIYLRTKTSAVKREYVQLFPDFLDLLIVCVDAGLSLNAAFDRVTKEFYARSRALAVNFDAMLHEIRIGRDMTDSLDNLANRMNVDEIRSFCTLIKQSIELGSDVTDALRVYSDEMRVRRVLKAEEEANKLPVKMLLPLGIFIFPVIMIVILSPIAVKVSESMK